MGVTVTHITELYHESLLHSNNFDILHWTEWLSEIKMEHFIHTSNRNYKRMRHLKVT